MKAQCSTKSCLKPDILVGLSNDLDFVRACAGSCHKKVAYYHIMCAGLVCDFVDGFQKKTANALHESPQLNLCTSNDSHLNTAALMIIITKTCLL